MRNFTDQIGYGPSADETLPMAILIGLLLAVAFVVGLATAPVRAMPSAPALALRVAPVVATLRASIRIAGVR